jgi:hypothetical protein
VIESVEAFRQVHVNDMAQAVLPNKHRRFRDRLLAASLVSITIQVFDRRSAVEFCRTSAV